MQSEDCAMNSQNHPIIGEGLTYDDVLLLPHFSDILPREVSINSHFTKGIGLQVPIGKFGSNR